MSIRFLPHIRPEWIDGIGSGVAEAFFGQRNLHCQHVVSIYVHIHREVSVQGNDHTNLQVLATYRMS